MDGNQGNNQTAQGFKGPIGKTSNAFYIIKVSLGGY